jgi:hypothetical protein
MESITSRRWKRPRRPDVPLFDASAPRSAAEQLYDQLSDQELIDFVGDRLPRLRWRIEHAPRCAMCRPRILAEIARHPPTIVGDRSVTERQAAENF